MEYAPLEKRPDQPETNTRTDAGRFADGTFLPAAESEYGSVWPYMPDMHVGSGMGRSEMEAMFWQAHFGRSSGNPLLDALNPFARRLDTGENEDASSSANTSTTISRAPAVQPSTGEEGFPLNEAQSEKVDMALAEAGQPLPEPEKAVYEAHTGHNFSRVRIHTGSAAEEAADSIGAKAFAKGNDVVFAKDEYNPSTAEGRGLIGHELAHVAQNATGVHRAPKEREKDAGWQLPEVAKKALSKLTAHLPGYDLIKIVLGKDPLTDQPVSSSPDAIVRAIVGLIPGGAELYNRLNQTKAVTETLQWFTAEFEKLNIPLPYIIGLFKQAWDEMGILKGTDNLDILKRIFSAPVTRIKVFIVNSAGKVQEIVLKGTLKLVGPAVERVYAIINKGKATLGLILADPIGFARNLMAAVGQGFKNFVSHFVGHLQKSLQSWLFGTLGKAGITLPESIDAKGIFHLALQILGLTYQNIRGLIVSKVGDGGEEAMTVAEKSVEIVEKMATEGPQAMWDEAKAELPKMRDTVIGSIIDWVRNTIIVQAVTRLLGMFTPVGAILEAGRGIYNTIMFFVQKAEEIAEVVNSIFASITNIAHRRLSPAASYIESTLGKGLTLSIAFLAKYIGLGGIPEKIKAVIAKVKKPVDTAVGKVTGWIADKVKLIVAKIKGGVDKVTDRFRKKKDGDADQDIAELPEKRFRVAEEEHSLWFWEKNGQPVLLVASHPKELKQFLGEAEVQKLKANDPEGHVASAEALADQANFEAKPIVEALKKKDGQLHSVSVVTPMLEKLVGNLSWIFNNLPDQGNMLQWLRKKAQENGEDIVLTKLHQIEADDQIAELKDQYYQDVRTLHMAKGKSVWKSMKDVLAAGHRKYTKKGRVVDRNDIIQELNKHGGVQKLGRLASLKDVFEFYFDDGKKRGDFFDRGYEDFFPEFQKALNKKAYLLKYLGGKDEKGNAIQIKGGGETGWWGFAGNFRDKESGDLLSLQQLITKFSLDEKRFAAGAVLFQFDPKHLLVEAHKTTALDGVPFAEWSPAQGLFGKTKGGENEVVTGPLPYSTANDIEVIL